MTNPEALLPPGFRFHPTDEELILHYLMKQAASLPCPVSIIAEVDIYKFDPWDLPAMAMFGDREWYFFSPRDRKYPNGVRPNRAAASGYWKATGTDKPIVTSGPRKETVGVKKALVFYTGKPPKGIKTKWIMHEYRLVENHDANHSRTMKHRDSMRLDDWVLCRIYRKSGNPTISDHGNHDDINSEDAYPPAGHGAGTSRSDVRLPKSSSLSQLLLEDADFSVLSRLLYENPSDMVYPEPGSHLGEANPNHLSRLYGGGNGTDTFGCSQPPMTHPTAPQPPLAAAGSRQMRQRPASDYADGDVGSPFLQPRKYATVPLFSYANMSNPAPAGNSASVQCNNTLGESQTFLHQQMLLNPHPGLNKTVRGSAEDVATERRISYQGTPSWGVP